MTYRPKRKLRTILATLFILVAITACATSSPSPTATPESIATATATLSPAAKAIAEELGYVPIFEPTKCHSKYRHPPYETKCGYLVVPEDRSQPGGPTIRLPVVVFKSASSEPAPDPVIYLAGGGGYNQLDRVDYYLWGGGGGYKILETRDYVMYNQRGAPLTEPALACPDYTEFVWELAGRDLSQEERNAQRLKFLLRCHDDLLKQGINPEMYNSATNAADANDLRIALGYEQANYYGTSYGTKLGLTLIRDYPEGVRSLIIDSVYPPQVGYYSEYARNAHRAYNELFDSCVTDAYCNEQYPNLEKTFYQAVDELNANPVTITYAEGDLIIDGGIFMDGIFFALYSRDTIPAVPHAIYEASRGNLSVLKNIYRVTIDPSGINWPMFYSMQCREEVPFDSYKNAFSLATDLPPQLVDYYVSSFSSFHFTLCESWQVEPADPIENEPVISDVPTLVLAGQFDPVTPPEWGRRAAESLSNSYFYEFPGWGHGVMRSSTCGLEIGLQFLNDPTTKPDTSCIDEFTGPNFE
jgi:pimeloyl-ACP methyl ester carboxylesterase